MKFAHARLAAAVTLGSLAATGAWAADLSERPDDSWISMSGTVTEVRESVFRLDTGDGQVTVEMDDFDTYGDAYVLTDGDTVTVYGRVDDDLFEKATIEAGSVYVEDLNTYFYASAADEEDMGEWVISTPVVVGDVVLVGEVISVDRADETFTIDEGAAEVTVDVGPMLYDPLDDAGYQQISVGDRVSVAGELADGMFADGYMLADSIVTLAES